MTISAAESIRTARARAGLSQVELAARAGVTQSVISTYEAGRRNPSFDMMTKLLGAAGASLVIEYVPDEVSTRTLPDTPRVRKLLGHRREILDLVHEARASNVRVFGSVARGDDGPESDYDLLIDIPDDFSLFDLSGLTVQLGELLGEHVDVVHARGLQQSHIRENALKEAIPI